MGGWAAIVLGVLLTIGIVPYGVGLFLPHEHQTEVVERIAADPARVAALIRKIDEQPQWRIDVKSIEVLETRSDGMRYIEKSRHGNITFDFSEERRGKLFRITIVDPDLPFAGSWSITLTGMAGGTMVRIQERGEVKSPIFRFFSSVVFAHDRSVRTYLAALKRAAAGH